VHVIGAGPQSVYVAFLRRALRGIRVVFTAQGELTFDAHGAFERSAVMRSGLRRMLRAADEITACSAYVLGSLDSVAHVRPGALVIPNGVDPFEFDAAVPETGLRRFVLGVGRLVPQKGFDTLLEALAGEALAGLDVVLAGDGFELPRLQADAERLGIGRHVHFVGAVGRDRLASLMKGARIFAFPSRGEPFGIALIEAMAAGLPCVAAAAGGVPEIARDGIDSLLVPPDDPDALREAIARLEADPLLRSRIAEGGRETAAGLSWLRIEELYVKVYRGEG
jgi:glycosyltransferase involved in cell wall biosynthesis